MLDAAIRRVAAVTEEQRQSHAADAMPMHAPEELAAPVLDISAGVATLEPNPQIPAPAAAPPSKPVNSSETAPANTAVPNESVRVSLLVNPTSPSAPAALASMVEPKVTQPASPPPAPAASPQPDSKQEAKKPAAPSSAPPPESRAVAPDAKKASGVKHPAPLTINELRLCRNVMGFGAFEPLNKTTLKPGQHLLIYCELAGLEYEAKASGFVSRISSRIELRPVGGGAVQWEQDLGVGEDACRRRRQDYYVNYIVDLPQSLSPGPYRLRLVQTDLVAVQSASADIPIEIAH
jgi:hypothetical protein